MPWTPPPGGVDAEHRKIAGFGRRVRVEDPERRPGEQLPQVEPPAGDVAADVVRRCSASSPRPVRSPRRRGSGPGSPGANRSIWPRIGRVMSTVEPFGTWQYAQTVCLPAGARVGSNRLVLGEQHERPLRDAARGDRGLRRGDLLERAAEVDRRRREQLGGAPRDRAVEREVELEDARSVAEAARAGAGSRPGARSPAIAGEPAGRRVEQRDPVRRQVVERASTAPAGLDPPAERLAARRRARGDRAGAALRERPAVGVRRGAEHEPGRRADRLGQRQDRVGGDARRTAPARRRPGSAARARVAGWSAEQPEPRQPQRPRRRQRHVERAEQVRQAASARRRPAGRTGRGRRRRRRPARAAVSSTSPRSRTAPSRRRAGGRAPPADRSSAGRAPREPAASAKNGDDPAERVDRAADVVDEAGQRQLGRARPATWLVGRLEDRDPDDPPAPA